MNINATLILQSIAMMIFRVVLHEIHLAASAQSHGRSPSESR